MTLQYYLERHLQLQDTPWGEELRACTGENFVTSVVMSVCLLGCKYNVCSYMVWLQAITVVGVGTLAYVPIKVLLNPQLPSIIGKYVTRALPFHREMNTYNVKENRYHQGDCVVGWLVI